MLFSSSKRPFSPFQRLLVATLPLLFVPASAAPASERGALNTSYENLSVFERRFIARSVQHTGFNTPESMDYLIAEVALPAQRYTGACWYAAYRGHNFFGDSIHGPQFYAPFQSSWASHAEIVRNVGGVCGSLSNFGAAAAIANGVPAVTMGEPGHCAYAVMIRPGEWHPAYTLSWQRGMHTAFHGGSWGWHQLGVAAQRDTAAARRSGELRRLARHHLAHGRQDAALGALALARPGHPSDWENWCESQRVREHSKAPLAAWQDLHRHHTPGNPALQVYSTKGHLLVNIQGRALRELTIPSEFFAFLNSTLAAAAECTELRSKLETADATSAPELLARLLALPVAPDPAISDVLSLHDPEDRAGHHARLHFPHWQYLAQTIAKTREDMAAEALDDAGQRLTSGHPTPSQRALILGARGIALHALGRIEEAWKSLDAAREAAPGNPEASAVWSHGWRIAGQTLRAQPPPGSALHAIDACGKRIPE